MQVCVHIIHSLHTEMLHMKEDWEVLLSRAPPAKQPSRQASSDAGQLFGLGPGGGGGGGAEGKTSSDTYCHELLSMLVQLSRSELGCEFLSQQEQLIQDLLTLLHIATVKIQLQVRTCMWACTAHTRTHTVHVHVHTTHYTHEYMHAYVMHQALNTLFLMQHNIILF